eukprot:scaffold7435_cov74-Skeletonema_menzelii.AAC.10
MSTKIKGGGRAILSKQSQHSLIDLLFSLEETTAHHQDGRQSSTCSLSDASQHDRKQLQKKFVKRLVRRHEQRVLREQFNVVVDGTRRSERVVLKEETTMDRSSGHVAAGLSDMSISTSSASSGGGGNVRIELAEAIFASNDESSNSKKSSKKESKKDKDKTSKKKKRKDKEDLFKIGTKKVVVLPRSTSISNVLKQSKSKLKLKKNPVRAFVQTDSGGGDILFDLEHDLSGIVDGTVVYVTLTPKPNNNDEDESTQNSNSGDANDDEEDDDDTKDNTDALLDSIKLAYKQQQSHRNSLHQSSQQQLERVAEVIDTKKQQIQLESRQCLPVAAYKQQILDTIHQNQVVVLSGATGSGKSTQVPQLLLESHQDNFYRRPYIIVTQPRRVAAISLAQRVAQERGCPPPGQSGSSIGYMVRLDRRVDYRCCRVIYMTIGVLLRILLNSESRVGETEETSVCDDNDNVVQPLTLESISHLVIDETHERDVNTDFTLTLLKGMMIAAAKKSPQTNTTRLPRLILMSATASSELFVNYFTLPATVPATIDIPGRTFPVKNYWLADCEKFTGKTMTRFGGGGGDGAAVDGLESDGISSPRAIEKIDDVFIRSLIVKIVEQQQNEGQLNDSASNTEYRSTGAILVFLPGLGEIESLARCLYDKGTIVGNRAVCNILKLHSTIPKSDQGRVFEPALKGTIKIILSTNIAETSLTIEDVSYVIDTCRVKESRYQSSSRIKELVTVWTSHAAMKQRAGRAGRTSTGTCYRLCSEDFARKNLLPQTSPEMVRTPLDELILQVCLLYEQRRDEASARMKSSNEKKPSFAPGANPLKFLAMTPTQPQEHSLVQSCKHLLEVDALKVVNYGETELESDLLYRLTPIGYHCSKLPMDAKLAKTLIVGCILGVLDNALIIAASLSCTKSCFMSSRQLDPTAVEARDLLIENGFGGRDWHGGTVKSDMIAAIAVYRAWTQQKDKKEKFCRNHALNYMALREIDTLRHQFLDLVIDAGLASRDDLDDCNIAKDDALITSCCLVAGLYPNICTLVRPRRGGPKGGRLLTKDGEICRPSSSSFQRKRVNAAAENGKDAYAIYHAKHTSIGAVGVGGQRQRPPETFLSEVNFVSKFSLLLFGGQLELVKNAIIIDGWLKFKVGDDTESKKGSAIDNAVLILSLRDALDKVILEHVVETFASSEEKLSMMKRHKQIIEVVRQILSEEG